MTRNSILGLLLSCSLTSLAGCGDDGEGSKSVCEQAGDVLVNECGFEQGDGGDGGGAACEGVAAATSQCAVDFPDEACEAFANITDPMFSNSYTECVVAASS